MATVFVVSKPCGCIMMRTLDKAAAVAMAQDQHAILDAISCRSEEAKRRALDGPRAIEWDCACSEDAMLHELQHSGPAVG